MKPSQQKVKKKRKKKSDKQEITNKISHDHEMVEQIINEDQPSNMFPDFWNVISPDGLGIAKRDDDYFTIKQSLGSLTYGRPFYIPPTGYPRKLQTTWLQKIINAGEVDVMVDIHKLKKNDAMKMYQRQLTILESNLTVQLKRGNKKVIQDTKTKIADINQLMEEVQLGYNDSYYVGVNGIVYGDSLKDLNYKSDYLEDEMAGNSFKLIPTYRRIKKGLRSVSPFARNEIPESLRNMDRRSLSTLAPFISGSGRFNGGIPIGVNRITGQKEFFNAFGTEEYRPKNMNMAIFGVAGSGKSLAMKLLLARETVGMGVYTRQIDVEGEFVDITRLLGGVNITLSEESDIRINPLDINVSLIPIEDALEGNDIDEELAELEESDEKEIIEKNGKSYVQFVPIREKINEVLDFFDIISRGKNQENRGLNVFESAYLEEAIKYLYTQDPRFKFTTHPSSLYREGASEVNGYVVQEKVKKEMPTISDVYSYLINHFKAEPEAKHIIHALRPFLRDSSKPIFDGQTYFGKNVPTDLNRAKIVNFNLKHMEEGFLRPVAYHVILNYLWEDFVKAPEMMYVPKIVNADEFWTLIENEQTVSFAEKLARRIRKRNGGFRIASQDFVKVAKSPKARAILQNTQTYLLFEQNKIDLKELEETFNLSKGELNVIVNNTAKGEGLLKQGNSSVWLRTDPSDGEMLYVESNKAVLEERKRKIRR